MTMFDENSAVKFIAKRLSDSGCSVYSDDEILNIIDMIWDFYETRGLLDPDGEVEPDRADLEAELLTYAKTMLKRDKKAIVSYDDLPVIIAAELDYEDSLLDGDEGLDDVAGLLDEQD